MTIINGEMPCMQCNVYKPLSDWGFCSDDCEQQYELDDYRQQYRVSQCYVCGVDTDEDDSICSSECGNKIEAEVDAAQERAILRCEEAYDRGDDIG